MSETRIVCPKCNGEMTQGFTADFAFTQGVVVVSTWVEGPPKKQLWSGTKTEMLRKLPIATFRCESCGFLETYARKEFAAK